jgi:hypothetical protein
MESFQISFIFLSLFGIFFLMLQPCPDNPTLGKLACFYATVKFKVRKA